MSVWLLCALLSSLVFQTEQNGLSLTINEVKVYAETDASDYGAWVLNVAWRDELKAGDNEPRKVSYDIEVLRTEQMTTVHFETIHVTPDNTSLYHWNWTSPIPLQCTSHSVRLRHRDQHHIGEWTPLYTYEGQDVDATEILNVYPREHVFMVGSNITFCCILGTKDILLSYDTFPSRISNRTYTTEPIHFPSPSDPSTDQICEVKGNSSGSSVFFGYPPDDQNLICETRDLSSVECRWENGRKTNLVGLRKTIYTLNGDGSACDINKCVLPEMPNQVTKWTLIAKNALGVKTLTDTADPTHRVWLRPPSKISYTAYARRVTLQWSWNIEKYTDLKMICKVMLNETVYNETFRRKGLSSIDLYNLQPFAHYTVRVSCGSDEHFYKWSDWSDITAFTTKEDIPEAVDVWFQYFEENTYVLWKPPNHQKNHGKITQYEITQGNRRDIIDIGLNTPLCYSITPGNETSDQNIKVSAKNSAGLSPPSTIMVPGYPENEVNISSIRSCNGGFEIVLDEYFNSTCGYVVEWFPTYNKTQCAVQWTKIPESELAVCRTWEQNGPFQAGVKYTVSVYGCLENKPVILQRSERYAIEQKPSGKVQNLRRKMKGRILELFWDEVPLQQQNGFIQGYKVFIANYSASKGHVSNTTVTKERKVTLTLDPGTYHISVSAFTSEGDAPYNSITFKIDMEKNVDQMIATTVVGCSAATLVFITITVLCYRKRKWLKKLMYPDIPKPKLAGKWTTKDIYCTQMTEGYMKCEIQEVHSSERPAAAESPHGLDLFRSNPKVFTAQHFFQNISESPADVSYYPPPWSCAQKLTSIIENPSYNMTIPDHAQISELTLEMQDSYLPAPNFVQKDFAHDTVGVAQISEPTLEMQDSYLPAPNFVQKDFAHDTVGVAQISELTLEMQDSYLPAPNFVQKDFVVKESMGYKPQSA